MPSPKSKSPKGSPKSGSGGKKSAGKNSPKKIKGEIANPVENEAQTEPSTFCYLCLHKFKDHAAIQAHTVVMNHMPPFSPKEQQCRACQTIVHARVAEEHKCAALKATFLRFVTCSVTLCYGAPYRCLFCRSKPLRSRVELAMHLLCYHRPNKPSGRCGLCNFAYEEPQTPQLPNIPPLPPNADEERRLAHAKEQNRVTEAAMCEPSSQPTPGLDALEQHIASEHTPAYSLLSRQSIIRDSFLRFPYACPICGWSLKSNFALHAHILCCHGNATQIQNELYICAMCGFAGSNDAALNQHLLMNHAEPIRKLGRVWIKRELMMNVTDLGSTCAYCWQVFKYDFQVQAHLLAAHTTNNALRCGWCKVDFQTCPDPILAFMIMQHHEWNHARPLHQIALDKGLILEPLKDELPEVMDKEQLITARLAMQGDRPSSAEGRGKKSPKGSPKKSGSSKKSGSPKSKSPTGKSGSPKSGSKKGR